MFYNVPLISIVIGSTHVRRIFKISIFLKKKKKKREMEILSYLLEKWQMAKKGESLQALAYKKVQDQNPLKR